MLVRKHYLIAISWPWSYKKTEVFGGSVAASMTLLRHILLMQINKNPSNENAFTNYLYLTCQPYSH